MNVLEKIVVDKRIEVAQREIDFPLESFKGQLTVSDRDFKQALIDDKQNKGAAYIFECKKASPSKGLIRAVFDLDEICQAYSQYASCVSVLTDEKYFQGEFERLPLVRSKLLQPVLCKDFFVEPYQVYLARHFGGNAILLMLSVLDDETYIRLDTVAKELGMHVLTEVSNREEMERAVALKCDILGINNRNLRDLSTDLNQTPILVDLFKSLADKKQQDNTVLISESGIYNHGQIKHLNKHVDGYLVGSSLMAQKDLEKACRELVHGQHKVCGITQSKDAIAIAKAGASFGGLIFVGSSKRCVTQEQAKDIISETQEVINLPFVAVVRNYTINDLVRLISNVPVKAVQLHGDEDQNYINELREALSQLARNIEIWQVVSVPVDGTLPVKWPQADRILLDTVTPDGTKGGSGMTFSWQNLTSLPLEIGPIMLAGGLNPHNINDALQLPVNGVDLNSGIETSPGIKDKKLVQQCFDIINQKHSLQS